MTSIGSTFRAAAAAACLAAAGLGAAASPAAAQNARWGENYFPNVTLTTQNGVKVRFYDDLIKGKIVAVNLIYTSCKYACPLETARLAQVQRLVGDRMGRDVFFYSITIDPDFDTPAVLKEYAAKFNAGPGWLFLTGSKSDIDLVSRKTGLYSPPDPSNPDGHTPHLLVGNEVTGQWLRNSGVDDPRFLATTISSWLNNWQTSSQPTRSYADAPRLDFAPGEYAFTKHCAACHTVGGGDRIGPDLAGVTTARDRAWLTRFIQTPDVVLAEKDAIATALAAKYKPATMPRLGLGATDTADIIGYLERQTTAARADAHGGAALASASSAAVTGLLEPYLAIQQALAGDSVAGVRERAREIVTSAQKLESAAGPVRSAATSLGQAADIGSARAAFGSLSDAILAYARQHNSGIGSDVKVAYCPMARKYWLQRGATIHNPFYGKSMLDCGRFIAEWPG